MVKKTKMIVNCNKEDSDLLCGIINRIFHHNYIEVENVEFAKTMVSNRLNPTKELLPTEVDCLKVTGSDHTIYQKTTGTLYVYERDEIFSDIYNWYLKSLREEKINILLK